MATNPRTPKRKPTLTDHEKRICSVEDRVDEIDDLSEAINKGLKYLKFYGPVLASAAISAGLVNGKVGAFINALLTGS